MRSNLVSQSQMKLVKEKLLLLCLLAWVDKKARKMLGVDGRTGAS